VAASAVIKELPGLVSRLKAKVFLDIPCGDFCWMKEVPLGDCKYIGGDLVSVLIEKNQQEYGSDFRAFQVIDLTRDQLPAGDVIMVRDCLIHLSFEHIRMALGNIFRSGIPHLLISNYPLNRRNWDIDSGGFRPINLCKWPFNLPQPRESFDESTPQAEQGTKFARRLSCWDREDIPLDFR